MALTLPDNGTEATAPAAEPRVRVAANVQGLSDAPALPPEPAAIEQPAVPAKASTGNYFDQFDADNDAGDAGLWERARLNQVDGYYRGTLRGASELSVLAGITKIKDEPNLSPEQKAWRKEQAEKYEAIVADLGRYELMAPFGGVSEGAVAFGGQIAGGIQSPESFLGWGAKGATALIRTGKAALQQGAISAAVDPVVQGMNIHAGVENEYSGLRTAGAFGIGAVLGGGLHLGGELITSSALKRQRAAMAVEDPSMKTGDDVVEAPKVEAEPVPERAPEVEASAPRAEEPAPTEAAPSTETASTAPIDTTAPEVGRPEVVAEAPKGPRKRDEETYSLLEFLASRGGLKPSPELQVIFDGNPFLPGFGRLIRKNGMSLDEAWSLAAREKRYIVDASDIQGGEASTGIGDLLGKLGEEARGNRQYQAGHEGTTTAGERAKLAEQNRVEIERAVDEFLTDIGAGDVDPRVHKRAVQIMEKEGVRDPDVAFERAVMEDAERYEKIAKARRETIGEIPGWDAPDAGAAPQAGRGLSQSGTGLERGGAAEGGGTGAAPRDPGPGGRAPGDEDLAAIASRQSGGALPMERMRPDVGVSTQQQPAAATGTAVATVPQSPQQVGAVRSLQQQAQAFADAIGFPLREGRISKPDALGIYKQNSGVVRVREVPDFEVVAHEGGHAIEGKIGQALTDLTDIHATELAPLVSNPAAYDPSVHVKEGFAEYIRRFIGNPAHAQQVAPGFTAAFRQFMEARHPDIMTALDDAAAGYRAYLNAPSVDAVGAVRRSVSETPHGLRGVIQTIRENGLGTSIRNVMQWAYTAYADRDAPLARVVREMVEFRKAQSGQVVDLKAADNPEILHRLFARTEQAAVRDMMDGVRPVRGVDPEGPSLSDTLAKATGEASRFGRWNADKAKLFSDYLIARRAEYLWRKFEAGLMPKPPAAFSKADAMVAMADLERANPTFREASDMAHGYTRQLLRKQYEGHMIDGELFAKLSQEEFYVPFYRDMTDKPLTGDPAVGGRSDRTPDTVQRMQGSSRDIKDPIESLMLQTFLVNRAIRHNDVILALRDLARKTGREGGRYVEEIPAHEAKKYNFDLKDAIYRKAVEKGMDPDAEARVLADSMADLFGEDPLMGSFFKLEPAGKRGEPIVFYKEGGQMKAARLMAGEEGHALYETITTMPQALNDLSLQVLAAGSGVLRSGIVLNPTYALANYIRDQMAVGLLRSDYIPFVGGAKGIVAEVKQTQPAQLYGYAGGVSAGAAVAPLQQAVDREINALAKQGWVAQRFKSLHSFLEGTQVTEAGTRNSVFDTVYKAKRRQGLSEYEAMIEAAYSAQDILDFSRWGSKTLALRALTPFVNSHIQGLDKAARTMIRPLFREVVTTADEEARRNAVLSLTKVFGVSSALGAAWAALHHDDETYQEAKPEIKGTHFVTTAGNKLIVIPKPFELSLGFTAGEFAYQRMMKDDPRAAAQFAKAAYEVLHPPIPVFDNPLIKVSGELALGKSFYTGREIVPDRLQRLSPELQFTDRTSGIAKAIGNTIGVSPMKVDHAIGGYFGLWGRDVAAMSSGIEPDSPTQSIEDRVFFRRFIKDPTRTSAATTKFWDFMSQTTGKYNQAVNSHAALTGRRSPEGDAAARDMLAKLPGSERAYVVMKNAADDDGKAAFSADQRRLHPLQRAYDAVTVLNGVREELSGNKFYGFETGDRYTLTPKQRGDLRDAVRELAQKEMRNALTMMKEPGYAGRALLDLNESMAKIRAVSPVAGDEIAARYASKKIYAADVVARHYEAMKSEVLRAGSDANLDPMLDDAEARGYEFGADRVKRPNKRRTRIGPAAGAPP